MPNSLELFDRCAHTILKRRLGNPHMSELFEIRIYIKHT